ncbi:FtsX-like permease family protein [Marispirochaeta sp.]|jgi:putative ABC transport system permease protein|uniref:ABC transporter permease n=1 Tax=Marispirochaeta sp. TaxID=2038653 RepID=UPI0029C7822B|nr:FtsX-like permease family protein [Marispirochaeta sp.]
MLFSLAFRNVIRNFRRLGPMIFSLVLVFALLVMGNAILNTTVDALYRVFARNITGDFTVGPRAEDNFTVFGSDQLLVGQYLVPPPLIDFPGLQELVKSWPETRATAGLITSAARVQFDGGSQDSTVFGVDFRDYPELVPGLRLEEGTFPEDGNPGIVLQKQSEIGRMENIVGKSILLASGLGRSFTLREVPVTGIMSYPVRDSMLDSVVLVDSNTARALNGYLYSSIDTTDFSEDDQTALSSDFDSLFGEGGDDSLWEEGELEQSIDPASLLLPADGSDTPGEGEIDEPVIPEGSTTSVDGAWNFLLVSLHNPKDTKAVMARLIGEGYNQDTGYLVRNWSQSVGGTALLAQFLQLMLNIGLLFVSFGAVIITTNALLLSVLERTGEIGTLRAMGASRPRISMMIFIETLLVVFGSALFGILIGRIALGMLNASNLVIDNPYIQILFGGDPVRGKVTLGLVVGHLFVALVLTLLSMIYPLKRALGIDPVEAMSK